MTKVLLPLAIQNYAEQFTSREVDYLKELNEETHRDVSRPVMLSGHLQGALLQLLSCMIRPKRILEIGTYTGYSAICLAKGLTEDGKLHTIELDEQLKDIATRYFAIAGLQEKVVQHFGKASDIIPKMNESFDLVFIDADKKNYGVYYDLVFDKIPVGGYVLADNVLFNGEVILPENEQNKFAKAIHVFNEKLMNDNRIEQVLLPVRDGIMIARKIKN
jgi:predicted O-methyltransferase YrrM